MSQREDSASHLTHATPGPVVWIQIQGPWGVCPAAVSGHHLFQGTECRATKSNMATFPLGSLCHTFFKWDVEAED